MKIIVIAIIFALFAYFMPIVPYDAPLNKGAVTIEHKTLAVWATEKYQEIQAQKILERRNNQ